MASFDEAVERTLIYEGGYSDRPDDLGGETNFGISKASHPSLDIRNLTQDKAKEIYKSEYWLPLYDQISDQRVANSLFDFGVNAGTERAIKTIQRALNDALCGPFVVDGIFGQQTLHGVNNCDPQKLLWKFTTIRVMYYTTLNKPQFLKGWIRRAVEA
jgi:lysozyme family protein